MTQELDAIKDAASRSQVEQSKLDEAVRLAREQGKASWTAIGQALGVTRQAAWKKYRWIDHGEHPTDSVTVEARG